MKRVLVDSNLWIALIDASDNLHQSASKWIGNARVAKFQILVAWPNFYEVLGTRTARRNHLVSAMHVLLNDRSLKIQKIDDSKYRDDCLTETHDTKRPLSLADRVMRKMIQDRNISIHTVLTSNIGDFADVCRESRIRLEELGAVHG